MRITLLKGAKTTPDRGTVVDIPASKFLDDMGGVEFTDTDPGPVPGGSPSLECADQAAKLAGPGFVLAQYKEGATSKKQADLDPASSTDILAYDIDTQSRAEIDALQPIWQSLSGAVYSTMKHTPEQPRIRLLVQLSRPVANASGDEYPRIYHAVAHLLGLKFDPSTKDLARFFFAPQHKPGQLEDAWRFRMRGQVIPVDKVLGLLASGDIPPMKGGRAVVVGGGPRRLPTKSVFDGIAARLLKSSSSEAVIVGATLEAVMAGQVFAQEGGAHLVSRNLAFALVREVPLFDGEGFAAKYMLPCWEQMAWIEKPTRLGNWMAMVESAESKQEAGRVARAGDAAVYAPGAPGELGDGDRAAVGALGGALVNEHRGNFYVWNARERRYMGPIKGTGLPAACREGLMGVPNFAYQTFTKNGGSLKSGPKLVEEYGYRLAAVNYWAIPPGMAFDDVSKTIHIPAYHWNKWDAVEHQIAGEFLVALFGAQLDRGLAWLAKFVDLSQPLPALVLVGPRGVWKSKVAQILSRFWGPRCAGTPCAATQVLGQFSGPLLGNPVIHTDEVMARVGGKAIPEIYRESIMSMVHMVEAKGVDPVALHTATRHIVSVNDLDQVFGGGEVDAASVEATVERYLVVQVDGEVMAAFEGRWAGYGESIGGLREGSILLEHVSWLAANHQYEGTCRLWVDTGTDTEVLLRARFADDTLTMCMSIAIEALLDEVDKSNPGTLSRLPLVMEESGQMRMSPGRIVSLWADSKITAGSGVRKPTPQRVGQMLRKAGFKLKADERACDSKKWQAWRLNHTRLREYIESEGSHNWDEIELACLKIWPR